MKKKIRIDILPNTIYLNEDGTYNQDNSIIFSGQVAGVCYDKEGFNHIKDESLEKTERRVNLTLNNGHHSVYDHNNISLNLQNVPKILAMIINNEKQYTTSEKSARYTPVIVEDDSKLTKAEEELYNKWLEILKIKIKDSYGNVFNDTKITKLAQENARYFVTVFMPTQMVYTTSFRQINYIASWMMKYIEETPSKDEFTRKLKEAMKEFVSELNRLNILEDRLLQNEKERGLSLFNENAHNRETHFGDVYSTLYKGSFAEYAQAQRHRTISYELEMLEDKEYFVPPIIEDDEKLVKEWLKDMQSVQNINPQGEKVLISERGNYEDFILKCKERLCSAAQLEIMRQTRDTLMEYKESLEAKDHYLKDDIKKYTKGARCTFPDFKCPSDCNFKEGKTLTRKI